jgi:hypothetical protein
VQAGREDAGRLPPAGPRLMVCSRDGQRPRRSAGRWSVAETRKGRARARPRAPACGMRHSACGMPGRRQLSVDPPDMHHFNGCNRPRSEPPGQGGLILICRCRATSAHHTRPHRHRGAHVARKRRHEPTSGRHEPTSARMSRELWRQGINHFLKGLAFLPVYARHGPTSARLNFAPMSHRGANLARVLRQFCAICAIKLSKRKGATSAGISRDMGAHVGDHFASLRAISAHDGDISANVGRCQQMSAHAGRCRPMPADAGRWR